MVKISIIKAFKNIIGNNNNTKIEFTDKEKDIIVNMTKRFGATISFAVNEQLGIVHPVREIEGEELTKLEKKTILKYVKVSGCDRDGDILTFVVKADDKAVCTTRDIINNQSITENQNDIENIRISKDKKDFIDIPIDIQTLESIARVEGCHYKNFDWWEVSQIIKERCLEYENLKLGMKK